MEKTEIFDYMAANGHEKLLCFQNEEVGLRAVLAIHSTVLGPAAGGCRMWTYSDDLAAMEDALRLSKGMTYKYAAAGINLGGGKIVVIGDPKREEGREMLFRALGRFIDSLGGEYLTGEDVGTTLQDMDHMRVETRNVITLPESAGGAGPIGPATAFGVLQAMRACVEQQSGSPSLRGKRVVVQGLGAVGVPMVEFLVGEGATVLVSDLDPAKASAMVRAHGATEIAAADVMSADVDVYCPCALGATINDESLAVLKATVVCGSANNQLAEWRHGDELHRPRHPVRTRLHRQCRRHHLRHRPPVGRRQQGSRHGQGGQDLRADARGLRHLEGRGHTHIRGRRPSGGDADQRLQSHQARARVRSGPARHHLSPTEGVHTAFTVRQWLRNRLAGTISASRSRRVRGPENEGTSWPTKLNTSGSTAQSRRP